jgi:hypothetical protein
MKLGNLKTPVANSFYRCAGPNCGILKQTTDRWWLMWTSAEHFGQPVLYLCAWDEEIANREGILHLCGEMCAQRLQSQFMGNVRESQLRKVSGATQSPAPIKGLATDWRKNTD